MRSAGMRRKTASKVIGNNQTVRSAFRRLFSKVSEHSVKLNLNRDITAAVLF